MDNQSINNKLSHIMKTIFNGLIIGVHALLLGACITIGAVALFCMGFGLVGIIGAALSSLL